MRLQDLAKLISNSDSDSDSALSFSFSLELTPEERDADPQVSLTGNLDPRLTASEDIERWSEGDTCSPLVYIRTREGEEGYLLIIHGRNPAVWGEGITIPSHLGDQARWIASCYPSGCKNFREKLLFPEYTGPLVLIWVPGGFLIKKKDKNKNKNTPLPPPLPPPLPLKGNYHWREW